MSTCGKSLRITTKGNKYWDILLQERIINQMGTKKFKKANLKSKCEMIKDIIHRTECTEHQSDLKEQITIIEHVN